MGCWSWNESFDSTEVEHINDEQGCKQYFSKAINTVLEYAGKSMEGQSFKGLDNAQLESLQLEYGWNEFQTETTHWFFKLLDSVRKFKTVTNR